MHINITFYIHASATVISNKTRAAKTTLALDLKQNILGQKCVNPYVKFIVYFKVALDSIFLV